MKFYRNIIFGTLCLMFIIFSGCAPEENDLLPPNAAFDSGVVDSPTNSTGPFSLSGTMDAGSTVEVDVLSTSAVVSNLLQSGTVWSFDVTDLSEGENIILVSVADAVGNTRTIQLSIVVDQTAPTTTIDQYPVIAQSGTFTLAGTVTEYNSKVIVEVIDSVGTSISITVDADADIWTALPPDWNTLLPGDCRIVATGIDQLGNVSATPTTQLFTIDAASPVFEINSLITLPVILSDPSNVSQVLFDGTRSSGATLAVTTTSGITGEVNYPALLTWDTDVSALVAGNTVVTFTVDDGGLRTEEKVLIVRDQTVPTVVEWSSPALNEIAILFNESMDLPTIAVDNLTVIDSTGTALAVASFVYDDPLIPKLFTFSTDLLTVGETYTATLQTTETYLIEDGRGNSLAASYSWTFKK